MRITSPNRIVRIYRTQPPSLRERRRREPIAAGNESATAPALSALWTAL